jgi:hypothetical protein
MHGRTKRAAKQRRDGGENSGIASPAGNYDIGFCPQSTAERLPIWPTRLSAASTSASRKGAMPSIGLTRLERTVRFTISRGMSARIEASRK